MPSQENIRQSDLYDLGLGVSVDEIYKVDPDDKTSLIFQDPQELIDTRQTHKKKNAVQRKNNDRIMADYSAADGNGVERTFDVPSDLMGTKYYQRGKEQL